MEHKGIVLVNDEYEGSILCNACRSVIKEHLTDTEFQEAYLEEHHCDDCSDFRSELIKLMDEKGLDSEALAKNLRIRQANVERWIKGSHAPTFIMKSYVLQRLKEL